MTRLVPLTEGILPESQSGFRSGRAFTDMIFTISQLQEKTESKTDRSYTAFIDLTKDITQELLFADDAAIVSDTLDDLRLLMDRTSTNITNWGLIISIPKTKLLYQAVPGCDPPTTLIKVDNEDLEVVQSFKYLGSTISASLSLDNEINLRVSHASYVYGLLRRRVWNSKHLSIHTKVRIYNAVVLPSLLYGCQTWSTYVRHVKKFEAFHQWSFREMMNTRWWQYVPNSVVLERVNLPKIETYLRGY